MVYRALRSNEIADQRASDQVNETRTKEKAMIKVEATIKLTFNAPDDNTDTWDLVRTFTTMSAHRLIERECKDVKPDIIKVIANGKPVTFKPRKR